MKFIYLFLAMFLALSPMNAKDWKALWITSDRCQSITNSWICYQKNVELPSLDGSPVYADIAVDSKYWMWIIPLCTKTFAGVLQAQASARI